MAKPIPAKWTTDFAARKIIANALGYSWGATDSETYKNLLFALRDGDVQARITYLNPDHSLSENCDLIAPDYWRADADGNAIRTPWGHDPHDGCIEIDVESLFRWLKGRQKPHRPPGSGMGVADVPFVAEIRSLLQEKRASSPTDAARIVIERHGARVPGGGTEASKIRRLVGRFKRHGE
jgi:hypothetical protein